MISDIQIEILINGAPRWVSFDEPVGTMYADHTAWLILSHLCSARTEIWDEDGNRSSMDSTYSFKFPLQKWPCSRPLP